MKIYLRSFRKLISEAITLLVQIELYVKISNILNNKPCFVKFFAYDANIGTLIRSNTNS